VAALEGIDDGVLVDESGRTQWLLARAPLAVLRARSEELRSAPGGVDGLPVSALLGVISARHEAPGRAPADIDTPADLVAAKERILPAVVTPSLRGVGGVRRSDAPLV
ncbi:hypothetical protein SB767_29310, partial [Bacillus sp. SIMBA_069]